MRDVSRRKARAVVQAVAAIAALLVAAQQNACTRQLAADTAWVSCRQSSTREARVRRHFFQNPLEGSLVDPGYWKQQYYLVDTLKKLLPNRARVTAMQLAPEDVKYVGYLGGNNAQEDFPIKLAEYVILGPVSDVLQYEFKNQCEVYAVNPVFRPWQKDVSKVIPRKDIHVAVVGSGTAKRLGKKILVQGLEQISAALTSEGRALLVCNEEDEEIIGGKMEEIMEAQEWKDMEKNGDVPPDPEKNAKLEALSSSNLRLLQVFRDECGLAIGLCVEEQKPGKKKRAAAKGTTRGARPSAGRRGSSRPGKR
mmetsp:Transcript_30667/g.57385  ORF Transcript_30667/g.57385 Transcript_30667/m.57385 type:complete len:309 (+) Transcript_30667:48-974(+)